MCLILVCISESIRETATVRAVSRDMGYAALKPQQEPLFATFLVVQMFLFTSNRSGKSLLYAMDWRQPSIVY